MNSRILHVLPPEILLVITQELETDKDLLVLATTCQQFNYLSLQTFFLKHKFDPHSKSVHLQSLDGSLYKLPGLAISLSLWGTSLEHLYYDFGYVYSPRRLISGMRLLTQYVSKLSTVDCATLRLTAPPLMDSAEWTEASITLLDTILEKFCKNLHITTSQPKSSQSFQQYAEATLDPWTTSLTTKKSNLLRSIRARQSGKATQHLKVCSIQTFPPFLRPFYLQLLRSNALALTDLYFKYIFRGGTDWATLITNIRLPSLKRFTVEFGVISREALVKFLSKHPHITSFKYHHIKYQPLTKNAPRLKNGIFDHLEKLITSPEHILNFFPSMDRMPALITVVIVIEEHIPDFSAVEGALRCLALCVNRIELSLQIVRTGLGFEAWLEAIARQGPGLSSNTRPERSLHCVERLIIDNGNWGFTENLLARLPSWMGLFPALRHLTLRDGGPGFRLISLDEKCASLPFVAKLKLSSKQLLSFSVLGKSEWSHDFTSHP
ncbi:hypothetical protein B0H34DRAFT_701156 [Crassisporium funariophilum]|nr:hypothetical protein B0H34DRAFT_701156 [Crassisporium funariophilum]